MGQKIIRAWNANELDEASYFEVGKPAYIYGCSPWKVGVIELVPRDKFYGLPARIKIEDECGNMRVSLPASNMAWEFEGGID